jgi:sugar lactone lactonase YvrE
MGKSSRRSLLRSAFVTTHNPWGKLRKRLSTGLLLGLLIASPSQGQPTSTPPSPQTAPAAQTAPAGEAAPTGDPASPSPEGKGTTETPAPTPSDPATPGAPAKEGEPSIEDLYAPDLPQKKPDEPAKPAADAAKNKDPILYISDCDNGRIVVMQGIDGEGFTSVGLPGYGYGRFLRPAQIWMDYAARLYIADSGNNRVVRIDQASNEKGWTEVDNLSEPHGVAVDGSGVYVSDTKADRVVIYDEIVNDAKIREVLTHPQMERPTDLWIDGSGALYICCGEDPPGGKLLKTWVENGLAETEGAKPKPTRRWAVFEGEGLTGSRFLPASVITEQSSLKLLDVSGQRLVSMQDITGKRLKEDKFRIDPRWRLSRPSGMAVDKEGHLYIADSGNDRILELSPDGTVVGEFSILQNDPGTLLSNPSSIFIYSPAPPPPPKEDDDKDGKSKGKGKPKLQPKKKGDDVEIQSDW